jgi:hypothetical protein
MTQVKTDPAHRLYKPAHIVQINRYIIQGVSITGLPAVQLGCPRYRPIHSVQSCSLFRYAIYVTIYVVWFLNTNTPLHKFIRKQKCNNRLPVSPPQGVTHTFTADKEKRAKLAHRATRTPSLKHAFSHKWGKKEHKVQLLFSAQITKNNA